MCQTWSVLDGMESILVVVGSALSSAHCYLFHSEETLYRLGGQRHKLESNPFSAPVVEQKEYGEEGYIETVVH